MQVFNYHATMKPGEGAGVGGGGGGKANISLFPKQPENLPLVFSFQLPRVPAAEGFFYLRSPGRGPRACLVFVKKTRHGMEMEISDSQVESQSLPVHCIWFAYMQRLRLFTEALWKQYTPLRTPPFCTGAERLQRDRDADWISILH